MESDDRSHHLIYRVLGLTSEEGRLVDVYQNKGRFLYRHAGGFLEEAARLCFRQRYPEVGPANIPNRVGARPKQFQVDLLIENRDALEVKWRDATHGRGSHQQGVQSGSLNPSGGIQAHSDHVLLSEPVSSAENTESAPGAVRERRRGIPRW